VNTHQISLPDMSPCPCCGHLVFEGNPGTEEICPVCFWQDDLFALLDPFKALGPNKVSLIEAQANFAFLGLCDPRYANVKSRLADPTRFAIEQGWRPLDPVRDRFPTSAEYPADESKTYYWRLDYWLK
jgi:hypothetical protein